MKAFRAAAFDTTRWRHIADRLAVLLAMSVPWSTTATLIIAAAWLLVLLPTVQKDDLRALLRFPAAWLVLALIAFAAIGMLWADVQLRERLSGFNSFVRLLVILLLFIQFQRSDAAERVLYGFIASCTLLLVAALISLLPQTNNLWGLAKAPGVPVKDYIVQSAAFSLAGTFSLALALRAWTNGDRRRVFGFTALGFAFLLDITFFVASRTALLSIPFLLLVLIAKELDSKRAMLFGAALVITIAGLTLASSTIRGKIATIAGEVELYLADNARTSAGERLEFWKKSVVFISEAPLIGHGTGSIRSQFERAATGSGASGIISHNPHNQTFTVGIQLGIAGILLLYAMWLSHLLLFRGPDLFATIGMLVVAQNILGSVINTHLFDFTPGWLYMVGVGVAGGLAIRSRRHAGMLTPAASVTNAARP